MAIAVIGWGSLIWDVDVADDIALATRSRWRRDGPRLPVEFARISQSRDARTEGRRLTLVLAPDLTPTAQPTCWAVSAQADLDAARRNLETRERRAPRRPGGPPADAYTHWAARDGACAAGVPAAVLAPVRAWLRAHREIEGCIWTSLASNWLRVRSVAFTPGDAIAFLAELVRAGVHDEAEEYLRRAPLGVDTAVRRLATARFGWEALAAPDDVFEAAGPGARPG